MKSHLVYKTKWLCAQNTKIPPLDSLTGGELNNAAVLDMYWCMYACVRQLFIVLFFAMTNRGSSRNVSTFAQPTFIHMYIQSQQQSEQFWLMNVLIFLQCHMSVLVCFGWVNSAGIEPKSFPIFSSSRRTEHAQFAAATAPHETSSDITRAV